MKPANYGPFYAAGLYPQLAELFRSHGYALAVHGSIANDFDLIAVPWVEETAPPHQVIREVLQKFSVEMFRDQDVPTQKPHGRVSFKLALSFGNCALDISFFPCQSSYERDERPISPANAR